LCFCTAYTYFGNLGLTKGSFKRFELGVEPSNPDIAIAEGQLKGSALVVAIGRGADKQLFAAAAAAGQAVGIVSYIEHAAIETYLYSCESSTDLLP
jgi:hypothetical protein